MNLTRQERRRLERSLQGDAAAAGLPDRTFTRSRGCWNCIHAQAPETVAHRWFDRREAMLARAVAIATQHPQGERNPTVIQIRRAVLLGDQAIAARTFTVCDKGLKPDGQPVGDFVALAYYCQRWTGRVGHSLAAHDDGKPEILPEELRERIDGPDPTPLDAFIEAAQMESNDR